MFVKASSRDQGVSAIQVEAAAVLRACRRNLAERGSNIAIEAAGGGGALGDWRHYPEGEVYDPESHAQHFYHRHPPGKGGCPAEHGHFHLFLRAEGMPPGMTPLVLPEHAVADIPIPPQAAPLKRGNRDEVSHLIAIAIDSRGEPIRLFTTNRWVTGETWFRAEDVIRMLDRFRVECPEPSAELNCWLGAMVRLFRPQIAALLRERDRTIMASRRRRRVHVFEDARLEITSSLEIDLEARLAEIERARLPALAGPRFALRLPLMDEGWVEESGAA